MKSKFRRLPVLSWREVVKVLGRLGFRVVHQRGSHIVLHSDVKFVAVPRHKEIAPGTLLTIIGDAGLTKEQFLELIDS